MEFRLQFLSCFGSPKSRLAFVFNIDRNGMAAKLSHRISSKC